MKVCEYCAEEIQDAAIVCKHCGREASAALKTAPAPAARRAQPATPAKNKTLLTTLAVIAAIAVAAWLAQLGSGQSGVVSQQGTGSLRATAPQIIAIASASDIDIGPGKIEHLDWTVPSSQPNCYLTGRLEVTSGGSRDVQVFVTTADEFKNLANGHPAKSYLATDKTTVVNLALRIGIPGPMVLAIGNTFSAFTSKRVQLRDVKATCT